MSLNNDSDIKRNLSEDNELNSTMKYTKAFLEKLVDYHDYKVFGLECFPKDGPVILITNHSLATYDGLLLSMKIYNETKRLVRGLGDNMLFNFSVTKNFCENLGVVPASPENAKNLLKNGEIVSIAPGGMRESLRHSGEKYEVLWDKRKGFARLSLEENVPIILAACPSADLIFKVLPSFTTAAIYKHFKFPLPIFHGIGPTPIPRPVKLTHLVAPAIMPITPNDLESEDDLVLRYHKYIVDKMEELMEKAREVSKNRLS